MIDNSYNTLIAKRDKTEQDYWNYVHANQQLQEKIERLYQAKKEISEQRDDFYAIKNAADKAAEESYQWKGDTYSKFRVNSTAITISNGFCYHAIERVLEDIDDAIVRLENQLYENESHMGWLKIQSMNINSSIRKFGI